MERRHFLKILGLTTLKAGCSSRDPILHHVLQASEDSRIQIVEDPFFKLGKASEYHSLRRIDGQKFTEVLEAAERPSSLLVDQVANQVASIRTSNLSKMKANWDPISKSIKLEGEAYEWQGLVLPTTQSSGPFDSWMYITVNHGIQNLYEQDIGSVGFKLKGINDQEERVYSFRDIDLTLAHSPNLDLSVGYVSTNDNVDIQPVAFSDDWQIGEKVHILPGLHEKFKPLEGRIIGANDTYLMLDTQGKLRVGYSGSPVVKKDGNVIGMITSFMEYKHNQERIGDLAVRTPHILKLLEFYRDSPHLR